MFIVNRHHRGELATQGVLATAQRSSAKAGGHSRMPRALAVVREFTLAGTAFPFDIVPRSSDKRPVDLQTEAHLASIVTLALSYPRAEENLGSSGGPALPIPRPADHAREHAALITFGAGQAAQTVEVDVAEGASISVPTQSVEITLLSYVIGGASPVVSELKTQASAAYGSAGNPRPVKTQRALAPLGLFSIAGVGGPGGPFPQLRDATTRAEAAAALAAAMARAAAPAGLRAAFDVATQRLLASIPPPDEIP